MSDNTRNQGCEKYSGELAELALGVLTGRERAQALSHVESCQRCADELEQLSRVVDTVVQAAPEVEPPMGFEVRLFEKMGVSDDLARRRAAPAPVSSASLGCCDRGSCGGRGGPRPRADLAFLDDDAAGHRAGPARAVAERVGPPRGERHDRRACRDLRRGHAVDLDDAG